MAQKQDMSDLSRKLSSRNSASYFLTVADLAKFEVGRLKEDILNDVQWRGYFNIAAEYDGKAVCAIIYRVFSDDSKEQRGVSIWAVFVDDKFVTFARPPAALPDDMEVVYIDKSPWRRVKPVKVGDKRFLIRALQGEDTTIEDLKNEATAITARPKPRPDYGLTAAYLLLRFMGTAPGPEAPATEKDFLRNAELRDQFNAARLKIGMTENDVEAVLRAKPIESGNVEAGMYKIFGSNAWFKIDAQLHYSNVLVVFRDGTVRVIQSIPAGYNWRRQLGEQFTDLAPPPGR